MTEFLAIKNRQAENWQNLLEHDPKHPPIHIVDMPFRQTSTWQDQVCEIGIWKNELEMLAWAVFQPPWWNLDYMIQPSERGSGLEKEIFSWGKEEMMVYSKRTGENFSGSVELFDDTPNAEKTIECLASLGFEKFDWSTVRFELALDQELPQPKLPTGYRIRSLAGKSEVDKYVSLHRAAFGSDKMSRAWRMRTLEHPAYRPEIDLVVVTPDDQPVGFCICWIWQKIGQIEPLGVHPDYQGRGLGRALELSAFEILRRQGARYVQVDHVSLNDDAIALSLKTGFRKRNNALRYYVDVNPVK